MAKLNKTPLTIRAKRGTESQITSYTGYQLSGEFAYATDTNNLYVSNGTTFLAVAGATPTLQSVTDEGNTTTNSITAQSINLDAENSGGIYNSTYSDVNILPKSNAFEFNVRTSSPTGKLRISTDGALYLASNANALKLGRLHSGQYPKGQLELALNGSGYTAFFDRDGINELMRVDGATGNVGIGTTAPTDKLHVVGNAKVEGNIKMNDSMNRYIYGFGNSYIKLYDNLTGGIDIYNLNGTATTRIFGGLSVTGNFSTGGAFSMNGDLTIGNDKKIYGVFGSNSIKLYNGPDASMVFQIKHPTAGHYIYQDKDGNELMRLTRDGNVGIGTTAPGYPLHIVASNNSTVLGLDAGSNARFRFAGNSTSGYTSTFNIDDTGLDIGHDSTARSLNLKTGNQDRLTILGSGNIGIGTTAPSRKLHIHADTGSAYLQLTQASTGITDNDGFQIAMGVAQVNFINRENGSMVFETNNTEKLRITSAGNVGIGATVPDAKLHVKATSGIAFKVDPNDADKEWYIDTTNPDHLKKEGNLILNADPTNVHTSTKISFNIDGSNKASINSDGDLGVGTTAQTSKVHVDGTAMRQLRIGTAGGPSSNTDTSGAEGDIAYDDLYLYIKTGSGWGRVALDFAF